MDQLSSTQPQINASQLIFVWIGVPFVYRGAGLGGRVLIVSTFMQWSHCVLVWVPEILARSGAAGKTSSKFR
jgi:hypothetical protein